MQNQAECSDTTPPSHENSSLTRKYPAIVHAAVLSAFLLPITLMPYLAARRQISRLRQTVMRLERKSNVLQSALDMTADSHNVMKAEVKRIQDLSWDAAEATTSLRKEVMKQNAERRVMDESVSADLRQLLDDSRHASRLPLHSLGTSLADVAAFMQEVELDFGMHPTYGEDRRGIERLRSLARQLQDQREPLDEVGEEEDATPWR